MGIGTTLGVFGLAGAGISAGSSLAAAGEQTNAANNAAELQARSAQNALDFQKQEWNTQQENEAPWLSAGRSGLTNLEALLAQPNQGFGETFTPPTAAEAAAYPGYEFGLTQGEGALENSAAAKGGLYSGNTEEALNNYAQNYAQNDYTNVYNQAFQQYQQRYGEYQNQLNRLAALSGIGQTAATTLGSEGATAAGQVGNTYLTAGAQQGQDIQNAAAATASGYVGAGNAIGGGLSNLTNLYALQQMFGNGGGGGAYNWDQFSNPANTQIVQDAGGILS